MNSHASVGDTDAYRDGVHACNALIQPGKDPSFSSCKYGLTKIEKIQLTIQKLKCKHNSKKIEEHKNNKLDKVFLNVIEACVYPPFDSFCKNSVTWTSTIS